MKLLSRQYHKSLFIIACLAFVFTIAIRSNLTKGEQGDISGKESRPDVITIDALKGFGPLETKEVYFLHDLHVKVMEKANRGCDTCHPTTKVFDKEALSLKFKRIEDTTKEEVLDIYHDNCIACHTENARVGKKSGPVDDCGGCHKEGPQVVSFAGQPKRFDKALHDLHAEITSNECSTCHHVKGKEASCRKCHKETDRKKIVSMKNASHLSCIGCHREMSGPVNCSECHNEKREEKKARPGNAHISAQEKTDDTHGRIEEPDRHRGMPVSKMGPVRFDHEIHREFLDKCDTRLRSGAGSCTETCHTADGSKQGEMITTEHAMHEIDNIKSCVGCHEVKKKKKECAGCHGVMEKGKNLNAICLKCHIEFPDAKGDEAPERGSRAAVHHKPRKPAFEEILEKDIPEKIIINKLSSQYGAVILPHTRIIDSMLLDINKSRLATHFHNGKETICLGCHHNSPPGKALGCDACHSSASDDQNLSRPGLMVAYHQQCIGCHDRMDIKLPRSIGCVDCHKVIKAKTK